MSFLAKVIGIVFSRPFLFMVMGPCEKLCIFPQLDVDTSHHHCANQTCGKKYHAVCAPEVSHPQAEELGLSLGSDLLCPSCVFILLTSGALPLLTGRKLNMKALRRIGREVEANASNMNTGGDVEEKASNPGGEAEVKKAEKKRVAAPSSNSTIPKKRSNYSTVRDGADVLDVPSSVACKKASMWKLQYESWCYDFSAQVPADFKIKG